jgi:hypothetical protein
MEGLRRRERTAGSTQEKERTGESAQDIGGSEGCAQNQ